MSVCQHSRTCTERTYHPEILTGGCGCKGLTGGGTRGCEGSCGLRACGILVLWCCPHRGPQRLSGDSQDTFHPLADSMQPRCSTHNGTAGGWKKRTRALPAHSAWKRVKTGTKVQGLGSAQLHVCRCRAQCCSQEGSSMSHVPSWRNAAIGAQKVPGRDAASLL